MIKKLLLYAMIIGAVLLMSSCGSTSIGKKTISTPVGSNEPPKTVLQQTPAPTSTVVPTEVETAAISSTAIPKSIPTVSPTVSDTDKFRDFKTYWSEFREAVLSRDMAKIKKYIHFPIQTRGPMDWDPVIEYNEDKFNKVFSAFLDADLTNIETNFDYIKRKDIISAKEWDINSGGANFDATMFGDNTARIENMEFKKEDKKWGLKFLYFVYGN